jgi:hypothetical protein
LYRLHKTDTSGREHPMRQLFNAFTRSRCFSLLFKAKQVASQVCCVESLFRVVLTKTEFCFEVG